MEGYTPVTAVITRRCHIERALRRSDSPSTFDMSSRERLVAERARPLRHPPGDLGHCCHAELTRCPMVGNGGPAFGRGAYAPLVSPEGLNWCRNRPGLRATPSRTSMSSIIHWRSARRSVVGVNRFSPREHVNELLVPTLTGFSALRCGDSVEDGAAIGRSELGEHRFGRVVGVQRRSEIFRNFD